MAPFTAPTSLSVTLSHAIAYLTRALPGHYSPAIISKLQAALKENLTLLFAPTWVADEPLRGSGRRCLTLSPSCAPPRPIQAACLAANVEWPTWIAALGGVEFDLFTDPGCVSARFGEWGSSAVSKLFTIWSDELSGAVVQKVAADGTLQGKTFSRQLMAEDVEDDEELFAMIADEMRVPTWMTPLLNQFPVVPSSTSSTVSGHSRSSSRSSTTSSDFSFSSASSAGNSYGSLTSLSSMSSRSAGDKKFGPAASPTRSRRARAKESRVFVDSSKTEVTPYDGGKTTVLTGGVMLGGAPSAGNKRTRHAKQSSGNWQIRA